MDDEVVPRPRDANAKSPMVNMKPTFELENPETRLFVGDCREVLGNLPEGCVDLVYADPPFNWDVAYADWNDKMPSRDYLEFTYKWLDGCIRVLAPHGSLWVNIPDEWAAEIVMHLKGRGLDMINWCIWHFRFGQCRDTNFIVSKVHVLYFAKDRSKRIWNPDAVLVPSDRATLYNDPRTQKTRRPGLRVPLDVWYGPNFGRIQGNNKERRANHRNQIPEAYMRRVIAACSNEGDLVLDPFLGSGTTCVVARALKRRSIGIELSRDTAASAYERVRAGPVRIAERPTPEQSLILAER